MIRRHAAAKRNAPAQWRRDTNQPQHLGSRGKKWLRRRGSLDIQREKPPSTLKLVQAHSFYLRYRRHTDVLRSLSVQSFNKRTSVMKSEIAHKLFIHSGKDRICVHGEDDVDLCLVPQALRKMARCAVGMLCVPQPNVIRHKTKPRRSEKTHF